ncbi:MAG: LuxR family transcriptional regulator [Bellilinea sp.]|nr:MAG: LuxR family transcriptional regulator [Bellilinea sp.]
MNMARFRIVIADDHSLTRKGVRSFLEDYAEYDIVAEAGDGPSLLEALEKHRPDCVLIDISMPDFEPITEIIKIREIYPELRILIISAHDDIFFLQALLRAGVNGYHLKGEPLSDFRLAVENVMAGGTWLSSPLVHKLVNSTLLRPKSFSLTSKQLHLLELLQNGLDNKTIAAKLGISIKTVENNLTRLYQILDVHSRLEAVNYANQHPELSSRSAEKIYNLEKPINSGNVTCTSVLLVDDNASFRNELRNSIRIANPNTYVYEAKNIEEAVQSVNNTQIEIAFIDMVLKEESGINCIRELKVLSPDTRFVLMSAYPDFEFRRLGIEAGAVAFIDKKDLDISAIRQIIANSV